MIIRYGSRIRLMHCNSSAALHSQPSNYTHPGSSGQQQVSGFTGGDPGDYWAVKGPDGAVENYRYLLWHLFHWMISSY